MLLPMMVKQVELSPGRIEYVAESTGLGRELDIEANTKLAKGVGEK